MPAECPPLTLTLPSDPRMLSVARAFVEAVCQTRMLDGKTCHAIVMATSEAVSNVIRHAHHGTPELTLQICCKFGGDSIEISVFDQGDPFDLASVPHLDPGELRLGGRGVFLMRSLMDELSCHCQEKCGNVLRMVKRWGQSSRARECG